MNYSGVIACVCAPFCGSDSAVVLAVEKVGQHLRSKKAAVVSPADLPHALDAAKRLDILLGMVRSAEVLVLLPGWGSCKESRAAWAVAEVLQMDMVFVESDGKGGLVFPALDGVAGAL